MFVKSIKKESPAMGGGGFHAPPPSSRPPTKNYDRQSFVLVVDESDEILKFMKMHLNRYFSHVVVARSSVDGLAFLKQKEFDVIITDAAPEKKTNADFLKKFALHWRGMPVILSRYETSDEHTAEEFPSVLVVDVVVKPFEMDAIHVAIRRALNVRANLKELDTLVPSKLPIGDTVRNVELASLPDRSRVLITEIRQRLTEDIVD